MTVTEDDLLEELRAFHADHHPEKKPGEFTAEDYAKANPPMTNTQADKFIAYQIRAGRMERVEGKRFVDGSLRTVYRLVKK